MGGNALEKQAAHPLPVPRRPERPEDRRWPPPTPLRFTQPEDVSRLLEQILYRLDAIEKRLGNIEKMLVKRQPPLR